MDYEEEFYAIQEIMSEAGNYISQNLRRPTRVQAAESQLARASASKQQEIADAVKISLDTLRGVIGQSLAPIAMQHSEKMLQAGQAIYLPKRPQASTLAGLRSTAEKIRAYSEARGRILDELTRDEHGLLDGFVIVEPER